MERDISKVDFHLFYLVEDVAVHDKLRTNSFERYCHETVGL